MTEVIDVAISQEPGLPVSARLVSGNKLLMGVQPVYLLTLSQRELRRIS